MWELHAHDDRSTIRKIQKGKFRSATKLADRATQRAIGSSHYAATCPDDGSDCALYAVSIAGVQPARYVTWFQAAAACANAGKRLATNAEWQAAALGTPAPGEGRDDGRTTCNVDSTYRIEDTGTRTACVSAVGAYDMLGNVAEWVAEWWPARTLSSGAPNSTIGAPSGLLRGGNFRQSQTRTDSPPSRAPVASWTDLKGFRCARDS